MSIISHLQNKFAYGECATFAIVLSKYYDLPIIDIYDHDDLYIHSMVWHGGDTYLDSFGSNSISTIKRRYFLNNYHLYDSSESDICIFANLDLYSEAQQLIDFLIKFNKLPNIN